MATPDKTYGKPPFPSMGPYLFSGQFLATRAQRIFQGGLSREDAITATAGGTQAAAYQLTKSLNRVSVSATAGDSVALPPAIAGSIVWLDNDGVASMNVFSKIGQVAADTINGTAGTTAFAVAAAKRVQFICLTKGAWVTSSAAKP